MNKKVGVIFADLMEYGPFLKWAEDKSPVMKTRQGNDSCQVKLEEKGRALEIIGVRCGIGKVNAASAAAFLIGEDKVDMILNAGLSGAIEGLRREDMVAVESYVECDYDLRAIGRALGEKGDGQKSLYFADEKLMEYALMSEGIIKAKAGTGDIFLADKEKKELYRDTFGIHCFDMESAAIASVCDKSSVPMLSLRKISDDADDGSAESYTEMNNRQEDCLTQLLENIFLRILRDDCSSK